ncbi:MAG: hypothetical protein K8T25_22835 [Planctomycetia bacterium]|nr:hypothetical protein [Planctomycetia bacterium]
MNIRLSRWATGVLVVAVVVLMAGRGWAVYYQLDPSKDEWGLKYDVQLSPAESDTMNVVFTLASEGRLKPIYSITVVAFSKPDSDGGRSYDVKAPIELKTTKDGKRVGQVQIPKKFANGAMIRILTLTVNGQRQTAGAAYYDIPLKKYLNNAPVAGSPPAPPSLASPPSSNATR